MTTSVDRVTVTTLAENYVDMLLPDGDGYRRLGLIHHFDPRADHAAGRERHLVPRRGRASRPRPLGALRHRPDRQGAAAQLRRDLALAGRALGSRPEPRPSRPLRRARRACSARASTRCRWSSIPTRSCRATCGSRPARSRRTTTTACSRPRSSRAARCITPNRSALEVIDGVFATGAIPRHTDFEQTGGQDALDPGLFHVVDGEVVPDVVPDDQALAINVERPRPRRAHRLQPRRRHQHDPLRAGGDRRDARARRHGRLPPRLPGHPGQPRPTQTIEAIRELDPRVVAPDALHRLRSNGPLRGRDAGAVLPERRRHVDHVRRLTLS